MTARYLQVCHLKLSVCGMSVSVSCLGCGSKDNISYLLERGVELLEGETSLLGAEECGVGKREATYRVVGQVSTSLLVISIAYSHLAVDVQHRVGAARSQRGRNQVEGVAVEVGRPYRAL